MKGQRIKVRSDLSAEEIERAHNPISSELAAPEPAGPAKVVAAVATGSLAVALDFRTAQLIRRVFLPHNPNKMRNCDPEVRAAAKTFISAFEAASARQENGASETAAPKTSQPKS